MLTRQLQSVLAVKTQPPAAPLGIIDRPALNAMLTSGTTKPVTLVSAGPGAGKTLTVAAWARSGRSRTPIGWLSLDASDNDLRSFWNNIILALVASGGVPETSPLRDITPANQFGATEVLELRCRLTELPRPVILVLDDFQEIVDDDIVTSFGELVDHLPTTLRLVLLTRADPVLRLHRLRVDGKLAEVRTADLAFDDSETRELFEGHGIALSADQAAALQVRTEGWAAGVRLAALSLNRDDIAAGIERFSGSERSVAEYLIGEVTEQLSAQDREFLLCTSIVERLNGPLAEHLTGRADSQELLENLVRANAFVVALGERNEWFSYHRLLRELLQHRLSLEQPATALELHLRTAQWMLAQGEPIESIRHSVLANDLQGAGRTLLSVLVRVLSLEGPALAAAIEPLARTAPEHPSLTSLLAAAGCHYHRQEIGAMLRDATDAKAFLDTAGDTRPAAEIVIALFELAAARMRADSAATWQLADHALAIIDRTTPQVLPTGRAFRAVALVNRAGAEVWTGIRPDTAATLIDMAREAAEVGLLLPHVNANSHVALIDAMHNRCTAAHSRATDTVRFAERRGWRAQPQVLGAILALALVGTSRHDVETAAGWVSRGLAAGGQDTDRALRLGLAIAAVQVAVGRGDVAAALTADARAIDGLTRTPDAAPLLRRWSGVAGAEALLLAGRPAEAVDRIIGPGAGADPASSWERVVLARARMALGDIPAAQQSIEPLLRPAPPVVEPAVSAALLQAVIADRGHRDSAALAAVTLAIDLAFNEGIKRPFVLIGGRIADLLVRYRNLGGRHDAFAAEVLELLRPAAAHRNGSSLNGSQPMVDPLTERESIVLHYLPTMLKAGEIADDLYVSVNTVKAHLRAIYRKLGVANRRDAVERARTSGLL